MPPEVGYADTSSPMDNARHKAKKVPENQAQIAVVGPPAASGADHVAGTEPKTPMIEMA